MVEITVKFAGKNRKVKAKKDITAEEALLLAKINPQTVIVKRGKDIIPDNERLENGDVIEALKIVSGG